MKLTFFFAISMFGFFIIGCSSKTEHLEKPNILLITTEGQAWEDVPSQMPFLKMPALEKLIAEGVVFQNHYSNAPLCQPAKYTIISGLYPHQHHLMEESGNWLPENTQVLMEYLSEMGYFTAGVGKMDFKPWERMAGFDMRISAEGLGENQSDTLKHDDYYHFLKSAGMSRLDYLEKLEYPEIDQIAAWPFNDSLHINSFIGKAACKFIEERCDIQAKPWFLWASFAGPMYPWMPLKKNFDEYLNVEFPGCRTAEKELRNKPFDHTVTRYKYMRSIIDYIEENPLEENETISKVKAAHYACLSDIDTWIGNIMVTLEKKGMIDNTVLVFTSTQGALTGDHFNFNGGNAYERAAHVPFLIWMPGKNERKNITGFTSHVDILPTIIELAGGERQNDNIEGKSLVPVLSGEVTGSNHAFIEIMNNYSIVTAAYKLGFYTPYKEAELYNRLEDANEIRNVFNNDKYRDIIDSLALIMTEHYQHLNEVMAERKEYQSPVTFVELRQGKSAIDEKAPYIANKPFKMMAELDISENASGPVVTYDVGNMHGFSLFLDKGYLCFGIRKWGRDEIFRVSQKTGGRNVKITFDMKNNGTFIISSPSLEKTYSFKSDWPIPEPTGRPEYFSKSLYAGISGEGWTKPYGNLPWGKDLDGEVKSCLISVGY